MTENLCPGKRSTSAQGTYGLCIRCDRLHKLGELDPAVRQENGVVVCENWLPVKMAARNRMSERV